jgi:hypothetical protein
MGGKTEEPNGQVVSDNCHTNDLIIHPEVQVKGYGTALASGSVKVPPYHSCHLLSYHANVYV